ncbi:MAG TPA: hypothetical protein VF230_07195 [Acidimicrobiales bacterium]
MGNREGGGTTRLRRGGMVAVVAFLALATGACSEAESEEFFESFFEFILLVYVLIVVLFVVSVIAFGVAVAFIASGVRRIMKARAAAAGEGAEVGGWARLAIGGFILLLLAATFWREEPGIAVLVVGALGAFPMIAIGRSSSNRTSRVLAFSIVALLVAGGIAVIARGPDGALFTFNANGLLDGSDGGGDGDGDDRGGDRDGSDRSIPRPACGRSGGDIGTRCERAADVVEDVVIGRSGASSIVEPARVSVRADEAAEAMVVMASDLGVVPITAQRVLDAFESSGWRWTNRPACDPAQDRFAMGRCNAGSPLLFSTESSVTLQFEGRPGETAEVAVHSSTAMARTTVLVSARVVVART